MTSGVSDVDTEKATRRGISVDTINRNIAMAMGDYQLGDVHYGRGLEPIYIVMQLPLRSAWRGQEHLGPAHQGG